MLVTYMSDPFRRDQDRKFRMVSIKIKYYEHKTPVA